jgi:hypothetical protein
MRCPMCSVSFILDLWTSLGMLLHPDSVFLQPWYISAYTVPSFNLSLLSWYCCGSKTDNDDDGKYTPPRND